ncbi:MAG: hypothetical protein RLY86_1817 [Pseudomonadota bacterium]|jgi:transcriptional regulator
MYTPPAFRQDDPAEITAFLSAHPLATLVTAGEGGLSATPLPMLLLPAEEPVAGGAVGADSLVGRILISHLAIANPHWRRIGADTPALAVFQGPGAYITPAWYPSKTETGKVVPTWNYMAVHIHGKVEVVQEHGVKRDIVTHLTDAFEATEGGPGRRPWAVTDAPGDYIAAMLKGIIGLRLRIDRVEAKWKLSQNKQGAEWQGVHDGLAATPDPAAHALARAMSPRE